MVEEYLHMVEQGLPAAPEATALRGEIAAIRATVASYQGDVERTILLAQEALAHLSPAQTFLQAVITRALGFAVLREWEGKRGCANLNGGACPESQS